MNTLYLARSHGNTLLVHRGEALPHHAYLPLLLGLGADTYIPLKDGHMRVLERDSSESDMCGNALRACIALTGGGTVTTCAGSMTGSALYRSRHPVIRALVSTRHEAPRVVGENAVNSGEPHLFFEGMTEEDFLPFAREITAEGAWNASLLRNVVAGEGTRCDLLTFERGVGRPTKSCGTGALACAQFLASRGYPGPYGVRAPGGTAWVSLHDSSATLTGLTTLIPLSLPHAHRNILTQIQGPQHAGALSHLPGRTRRLQYPHAGKRRPPGGSAYQALPPALPS